MNTLSINNNVYEASNPKLGGAPQHPRLGANPPFPQPPGGSGSPDPSVPSSDPTTYSANGYLDKLAQFIEYLKNHPNDPIALQNFMTYIMNLSQDGLLTPGSSAESLLNSAGVMDIITFAMQENIALAYFMGYGGLPTGQGAAAKFIADMEAFLGTFTGSSDNAFIEKMKSTLQNFDLAAFNAEHYQNGKYIWNFNGTIYDWSSGDDQDMIYQIIFNIGSDGKDPNSYYDNLDLNSFLADYRMQALEDLLKRFKNPEIVLALWMMNVYDKQFQGDESGLASTTDLLTSMTNKYATQLLELAQSFGHLTNDQALQFAKLFQDATNLMKIEGQLGSISKSWLANVYDTIANTPYQPNSTVGALLEWTVNNKDGSFLATFLNSLAPSSSGPGGTNPTYQTFLTALQQGGALITGTSKTVSTQLSTIANVDNEVIKFGHSIVDPTGGGFVQLENKIIGNQVSR